MNDLTENDMLDQKIAKEEISHYCTGLGMNKLEIDELFELMPKETKGSKVLM